MLSSLFAATFFLSFFSTSLIAQSEITTCGSDDLHKHLMETDENYRNVQLNFERKMRETSAEERNLPPVYTIPVVVHVIHLGESVGTGTNISDAQIQSAITNLTDVYRGNSGASEDVEIEFALATQDPDCNATSGILRVDGTGVADYATNGLTYNVAGENEETVKATSIWPNTSYYNIWVVSEINNNGGGSGTQGFAYFPGAGANVDGTVILYNAFGYDPGGANGYNLKSYTNLNTTTVHELGHGLNLYHTFSGDRGVSGTGASQCPASPDGCVSYNSATSSWEYYGDCVSDTPPHIRSSSNCNTGGTNACDGGSSNTLFVHNFMDYSSASCKDLFTADQTTRLRAALEDLRGSLITSRGLDTPPSGGYTPPITAGCSPATDATGLGGNFMGIGNVSLNTINYSSSYPNIDNPSNGYLDVTDDCQSNTELIEGDSYTLDVEVLSNNSQGVKAWIDYNNNGSFEDATELVLDVTGITEAGGAASVTFTVPSAINNVYLRMRVMDDFGSVGGACSSPTYGQAEDYAVLIVPNPLPVELVSFVGTKEKETVVLSWETASELNNDYFMVQRSSNGRDFEDIAKVQGNGTAEKINNYSHTDANPFVGKNYYRLVQNDYDGKTENSEVVVVEFSAEGKMTLYPNPVSTGLLHVNYPSISSEQIFIEVFDVTGKTLLSFTKQVDKGENLLSLPLTNLDVGLYYLRTTQSNESKIERFVKK